MPRKKISKTKDYMSWVRSFKGKARGGRKRRRRTYKRRMKNRTKFPLYNYLYNI